MRPGTDPGRNLSGGKEESVMKQQTIFSPRNMALMALFTALTCVLAPLSLPIGPVPISLTNLVLYLALYLLGTRRTALSFILYMLIGAVGLPVVSGFSGGLSKLAGPTGGYILGFLVMVLVAGPFVDRSGGHFLPDFAGMILGTALCYALGTAWFVYLMDCPFWYALTVCVFPFIPGDLVKMVAAHLLGKTLRVSLRQAHLL